jgi:hypothetical protein
VKLLQNFEGHIHRPQIFQEKMVRISHMPFVPLMVMIQTVVHYLSGKTVYTPTWSSLPHICIISYGQTFPAWRQFAISGILLVAIAQR